MVEPPGRVPSVVATIGLHGSASTWVFNVVREILYAGLGDRPLLSLMAGELAHLPTDQTRAGRALLIKSHDGEPDFDAWLTARQAVIVLSVRDPRDACLSMMQRFRLTPEKAVPLLLRDCQRIVRLAERGGPLLRYETRFFDRPDSVALLAGALGQALPRDAARKFFDRYSTASVRAYAAAVPSLPSHRAVQLSHSVVDPLTQIHDRHIGDTTSGKWRSLPSEVQATMNLVFAPFLERFGYERAA